MPVPTTPSASPGPTPERHYIVGTAGHIDHGKTSLVRALTGTDPDRLPEEQRRGMTIELGFAELTIGPARFGIVDVPGHERFVRTMVAGATGIDIALLVVAADDSVMPQSIEHVEILQLLEISRAVVALTKTDKVDSDMVELVADEVRALLEPTSMKGSAICPVSSVTGAGLEELQKAILAASRGLTTAHRAVAHSPFRMAVDRVFTVQGRGTVVTGSVLRGAVSEGDTLEVWPIGETCRVRGLQSHGVSSAMLARGQRAAVNISGLDRDRLDRGFELATPGYLQPARMVDVRLRVLSRYDRPLKSAGIVRLEIGTTELPVRVVLFEGHSVAPGESAYAQLRAGEAFTAAYGQRFILRDENAARTIGGGVVLRPVAHRKRRESADAIQSLRRLETGDVGDRVEEVLRSAGFAAPTALQLCARTGVELQDAPAILDGLKTARRWVPIGDTQTFVVPGAIDDLGRRLTGWLERHHRRHPELPGRPADAVIGWLERMTNRALARPLFDAFVEKKLLKRLGRFVCLPAFAPSLTAADEKLLSSMIEQIRAGRFQPPTLDAIGGGAAPDRKRAERLATLAVAMGELVVIEPKLYLHAESERLMREIVGELIGREGGATVAQIREALDSSRKFVVPFVEYLDRVGFTKRTGDVRVLNQAMPRHDATSVPGTDPQR